MECSTCFIGNFRSQTMPSSHLNSPALNYIPEFLWELPSYSWCNFWELVTMSWAVWEEGNGNCWSTTSENEPYYLPPWLQHLPHCDMCYLCHFLLGIKNVDHVLLTLNPIHAKCCWILTKSWHMIIITWWLFWQSLHHVCSFNKGNLLNIKFYLSHNVCKTFHISPKFRK